MQMTNKIKTVRKRPMVSVVIPSYNSGDFIVETLGSVFAQSYTNYEVILVDDASIDKTEALVRENFAEEIERGRLRYLRNNKNLERCRSRNRGVDAADGELIAFLDADDIWLPSHLEGGVRQIKGSGADMIYTFPAYTDAGHTVDAEKTIERKVREYSESLKGREYDEMVSNGSIICPPGWLIKKSVLLSSGGFRVDIRSGEDWELISRLYFRHHLKIRVSLRPTYFVRIHPNNTGADMSAYTDTIKFRDDLIGFIKECNFVSKERKKLLISLVLLRTSRLSFSRAKLKDGWKNLFLSVQLNPSVLLKSEMLYVLKRGFLPEPLYRAGKRLRDGA